MGRGGGRSGRAGGNNTRPSLNTHSSTTSKPFTKNGTTDNINKLNSINTHNNINTIKNNTNETISYNNTDNKNNTINNNNRPSFNNDSNNNTTTEMSICNDIDSDSEETQTLQSTRNSNTVKFQPPEKVPLEHKHIFCIYISAKKAHKNNNMAREPIAEHVLK
jgi:hypothetical protein